MKHFSFNIEGIAKTKLHGKYMNIKHIKCSNSSHHLVTITSSHPFLLYHIPGGRRRGWWRKWRKWMRMIKKRERGVKTVEEEQEEEEEGSEDSAGIRGTGRGRGRRGSSWRALGIMINDGFRGAPRHWLTATTSSFFWFNHLSLSCLPFFSTPTPTPLIWCRRRPQTP